MPKNRHRGSMEHSWNEHGGEGRFGVWLRIIGELSTAMSQQRRWRLAHRLAGACFSSIIHENTRLVAWPSFFVKIPASVHVFVYTGTVMIISCMLREGCTGWWGGSYYRKKKKKFLNRNLRFLKIPDSSISTLYVSFLFV